MERSSSTVATTRFSARGGPSARAEARGSALSQQSQPYLQQKAKKQGGGPRLNDVTRLEIIELLNAPNRLSLRKIGAQFGVCEATIRHIRDRSSAITSRALAVPEDVRRTTLRVVQKTFPELEELLAQWLESEIADRRASDSTVSEPEPEIVMHKAEEIAAQLSIPEHEFSASKIWFKNFQRRRVAKDVARDKAQLEAAARALVPSSPFTDQSSGGAGGVIAVAREKKRKRGSGPRLSDGQRLEIIEKLHDPNVPASNRKLAEEYKVDEATIRHIKLNAERLRERALNAPVDVRQTTFRAGKAKFTELETILAEWIDVSRRCNEEIPPPVVRRKAEEVAVELEIPEGEFKATLSWYASFCRRQGIGPVTPINNLEEIVTEYDPSNVFTVDETGLFYRLLPRHDELIPSSQSSSTANENAELMDRVSLVLCCNATGSERLPVSMISKEQSPKCKSSATDWPLPYFRQSKAWMDTKVFAKWFDEVFVPYISKRPQQQQLQRQQQGQDNESSSNSKVLLLLDNAPGHPVNFEKGDIRVLALHPKSTAWVQPLEMGVITALKNRYKLCVLNDILAYHALPADIKNQLIAGVKHVKKGTAGVFFGQAPHLLDAARRVADAWVAISPELLQCAFEEANFIPQFKSDTKSRSRDNNNDNQATAIRIEAEEFKLEEDMFKALRDFCHTRRRVQEEGVHDGNSSGDVSDAELAEELQTFLHLDDESSHVYQKCIMDDIDRAATEDSEASGSSSSDDGDAEPEGADTGSTSNTMNRILNGSASAVSASDVFNTATLLGMQLRQLRTSREFDAKQIEEAVVTTDNLRHQLQEASFKKLAAAVVAVPAAVNAAANGQQQQIARPLLSSSRIPTQVGKRSHHRRSRGSSTIQSVNSANAIQLEVLVLVLDYLLEALAADIFVGSFTPKYTRAYQVAQEYLEGTRYQKYYKIQKPSVEGMDTKQFAALCCSRVRILEADGSRWSVSANAQVIEQLTLFITFNLHEHLSELNVPATLERCWHKVARLSVLASRTPESDWRTIGLLRRFVGYTWHQMLFFFAVLEKYEAPEKYLEVIALMEAQTSSLPEGSQYRAHFVALSKILRSRDSEDTGDNMSDIDTDGQPGTTTPRALHGETTSMAGPTLHREGSVWQIPSEPQTQRMRGEMMSMGPVVELSGEIIDIEDLTSSSSVLQSSDSSGSLYDYTDEESGGELGENGVQVVAGKPPVSTVEAARKKQKKKRIYAMAITLITLFAGCGFIAESQDWFGLSFTTSSDAADKGKGGLERTSALSLDSKPSLTGSKRGAVVPEEDRKTPTSEALEPEAAEAETKDEMETKPDPKAKVKIEVVDSAALLRSGTRFQIQIGGLDLCLDGRSDGDSVNGVLSFQKCNAKSASQAFAYDPLNFFLMSKSNLGFCVDSGLISPSSTTPSSSKPTASNLRLYPCSFASAWQQMFEFDSEASVLRSTHLDLCMVTSSSGKAAANSKPKKASIDKKAESRGLVATLSACDPSPDHERLELVPVEDTDVNPKYPVLESEDQQFLLRSLGKYNLCLGGTSNKVQVVSCSPSDTNQLFTYNARTHWIQSAADAALCLDDNGSRLTDDSSQQPKSIVKMALCDAKSSNQRFVYDDFAMMIHSPTKPNLCLDDGGGYLAGESEFRLIECDLASGNQQFQIVLKNSLFSVPPATILAFDKAFVVESIYKGLCVDTVENSLSSNDQDDADAFQLRLLPCDSRAPRAKQIFQYDKELQMVRVPAKTGLCWSSSNDRKTSVITTSSTTTNFELLQILRLERCDPLSSTQKFVYDAASKVFQSVLNRELCVDDGGGWFAAETALSLLTCDDGSVHQKFHIRAA